MNIFKNETATLLINVSAEEFDYFYEGLVQYRELFRPLD
jgi:hypothetical protein